MSTPAGDAAAPMSAADLLLYLKRMKAAGEPMSEIIVRIEVSDSYYDHDLMESRVSRTEYWRSRQDHTMIQYLVLGGG